MSFKMTCRRLVLLTNICSNIKLTDLKTTFHISLSALHITVSINQRRWKSPKEQSLYGENSSPGITEGIYQWKLKHATPMSETLFSNVNSIQPMTTKDEKNKTSQWCSTGEAFYSRKYIPEGLRW